MSTVSTRPVVPPLTLHLEPIVRISDAELYELCRLNRELAIERTPLGDLIVMSPAGGETSDRNAELTMQLRQWAKRDRTGRAFDSSGGFLLPNGAMRAPDAAWVERQRLTALATEERERFLPLSPTFVIELRSPSDALAGLQVKMDEYVANGVRLGWLIDPIRKRIHVYRSDAEPEIVDHPREIAGEPELPGFVLDLTEIWDPNW